MCLQHLKLWHDLIPRCLNLNIIICLCKINLTLASYVMLNISKGTRYFSALIDILMTAAEMHRICKLIITTAPTNRLFIVPSQSAELNSWPVCTSILKRRFC